MSTLQQIAHRIEQRFIVSRLGQVSAQLMSQSIELRGYSFCQEDDRDGGLLQYLIAGCVPVHFRHLNIENHQLRLHFSGQTDSFHAIAGYTDVITGPSQDALETDADGAAVIRDQNLGWLHVNH